MLKSIILILFFSVFNICYAQDIVINEIMTSNGNTIEDDFGDYSDWVELYNNTSEEININLWSLSDDEGNMDKWQFPDTTIFPNEYLLVFCSGRDTLSVYLHSSFKLNSSKDPVILSNEDGDIVDQYSQINLSNNISFGRVSDGSVEKTYFYKSSPGNSNSNNVVLNEISFSHDAGFYETNIEVSLLSQNTEGQIFFTINGCEPNPDSSYTFNYSEPISLIEIQNKDVIYSYIPTTPDDLGSYNMWVMPDGEVEKHVVVRARTFENNQALCNIYTNTYFLGPGINERFSLPVLSIITDSTGLFDNDTGIYIPGKRYLAGEIKSGNYFERGDPWERKCTIELFSELGEQLFEQELGYRIHGNITRAAPQKALQFFPRTMYDGNDRMNYPFFEDRPFSDYKRIISRSIYSAHLQSIIRDEIAQDIAKDLNVFYQQWQPVISFINGEFWGIQNLREKLNEHYLEQHFDIDHDSVDIISLWGVVENGNQIEHSNLMYFTANNDFSLPENYEMVKTMIDIPAYIDYYITEIFMQNMDWPGNNFTKWRERGNNHKWRWFLYDLDATMKDADHNSLRRAAGDTLETLNPEWGTKLFKSMLQSSEFSEQFLYRFVYVLNNDFSPEKTIPIVNKWESIYENEIDNTINRWGILNDAFEWKATIQDIREFLVTRPCSLKYHLEDYFDVDSLDIPCENKIPDYPFEQRINVYPNPVSNTLHISSTNRIISWRIYNMMGALVQIKENCNRYLEKIDIENLSNGIYTVLIFDGTDEYRKKVIKK